MKKSIIFITAIAAFTFLLPACKEIGPTINLKDNPNVVADTTYVETPVAAETKNVVIEEFTGVQCTNCPDGHAIIATLKGTTYPGRICALALHPMTPLGYPMQGISVTDLEDAQSNTLYGDYQGPFLPCGMIDRQLFSGQPVIPVDKTTWITYTGQEIALTTPVNVLLSKTFDASNNSLTITVELHYTQAVTQLNNLTVALTESNIITAQKNGTLIDTFYVHNDVLRSIITNTEGDNLTDSLQAGRVIRKIYKTVLNAAWKPANMNIIAFVREYQNSKVIYQGKEISVQ